MADDRILGCDALTAARLASTERVTLAGTFAAATCEITVFAGGSLIAFQLLPAAVVDEPIDFAASGITPCAVLVILP